MTSEINMVDLNCRSVVELSHGFGSRMAEMQEWFVLNSNGNDVPDERSIRRRITPLWQKLKKKEET